MASSSTKLTKFSNSSTLVTADYMNSIFGGLSGTAEGDALDADDPRVIGHVHDGDNLDGHVGKIDLVSHVENQLRNTNLGDQAVTKRTVARFEDPTQAIPVSEVIDSTTFYYIDITSLPTGGAFATTSNITSNSPGDLTTDDFVFGSDSLDDDADSDHFNRLLFDKSTGALRSGRATSTQWDSANRGAVSIAFGLDNTATGDQSSVLGGSLNTIDSTSTQSTIVNGTGSSITLSSIASFVGAGTNTISGGANNFIGAGALNSITGGAAGATIVNGAQNTIASVSTAAFIGGGTGNSIGSSAAAVRSAIVTGENNLIANIGSSSKSVICGGEDNSIQSGDENAILTGNTNVIGGGFQNIIGGGSSNLISPGATGSAIVSGNGQGINSTANRSGILSGLRNFIDGNNGGIGSGNDNRIFNSSGCFIGSGSTNRIVDSSDGSIVGSGSDNTVFTGNLRGFIGSGSNNEIQDGADAVIVGGNDNILGANNNSDYSMLGGGQDNEVDATHSLILGGQENVILTSNNHNLIVGGGGSGVGNSITGVSSHSLIVGGRSNLINTITNFSSNSIVGGNNNSINVLSGEGFNNFIGGGDSNQITTPASETDSANYNIIVGGEDNIIRTDLATPGVFITHADAEHSVIGGGQDNVIEAAQWGTISGGFSNFIGLETLNPSLASGAGNSYGAITGGAANRVSFQGLFGTASGAYALSNSYGMVAQSSANFSGGLSESAGEAVTSTATFVGQTGAGVSTNYYIYLNSIGVSTSTAEATGYGLAVQPESSLILRWWAIGRRNSGGSPVTYGASGEALFDRNGLAAVSTISAPAGTALGAPATSWLGGGGSITPIPTTRALPYDIIFRINTGADANRPQNARWTIRVEATWVSLNTP